MATPKPKPGTRLTIIGSIWVSEKMPWEDKANLVFFEAPMDSPGHIRAGYTPLMKYDIDAYLPPDFDQTQAELAALRIRRKIQLAENESAIVKIDEEIQKRLAITDKAG